MNSDDDRFSSRVHGTISRARRNRAPSGELQRTSRDDAAGRKAKGYRAHGTAGLWWRNRLTALIRRVRKNPEGSGGRAESLWRRRLARTTGRERGIRPVSASRTELSGGASGRAGLRLRLAWKRRCGLGALTSEWRESVVTGERKTVPSFRPRLDLDFEDRSSALTRWRRKTSAASPGS